MKIHDVKIDLEYMQWLGEIKARYHNAQIKAAVKVNAEQLLFNWQLGRDLVMRKAEENGVQGLLSRLVWTSRPHSQKYLPTFPGAQCRWTEPMKPPPFAQINRNLNGLYLALRFLARRNNARKRR